MLTINIDYWADSPKFEYKTMKRIKIDKRKVRNEAMSMVRQGATRQETFNTLKEKYKYAKEIAAVVKFIPSKAAKKKYGIWNYILLAMLLAIMTLFMLSSPSIGILIWYGLLIYAVARMLVEYYIYVTVLSIFGLISGVAIFIISETMTLPDAIVLSIITLPSSILPIWISKRLCPSPNEKKESYTNKAGQQRLRIIYEFSD